MTQPITAEEARLVLTPHLDTISACLRSGWQRWLDLLETDDQLGSIISNRTRAGLVYDFIRHAAVESFDEKESVVISEDRGFLLLTFSNKIILRFKKFRSATLRITPGRSQQSEDYAQQALPGMEELTHLVAGYLVDKAGMDLKTIAITCSLGDNQMWVIDLDLPEETGTAATPAIPPQAPRHPLVRPKTADTDEAAGEQNER